MVLLQVPKIRLKIEKTERDRAILYTFYLSAILIAIELCYGYFLQLVQYHLLYCCIKVIGRPHVGHICAMAVGGGGGARERRERPDKLNIAGIANGLCSRYPEM